MNFLGDISHYIEMPKPEEIYDWERYTNPNYLLEEPINIQDDTDTSDNSIKSYNFTL